MAAGGVGGFSVDESGGVTVPIAICPLCNIDHLQVFGERQVYCCRCTQLMQQDKPPPATPDEPVVVDGEDELEMLRRRVES